MNNSPERPTINAARQLISEQWKSEQDYKKMIIALELQNEKYRNQLYELGETVNKILEKTKLPKNAKAAPNLDQQLQLVKKQLHNVNQFIEIYQRQLNNLQGKKKTDQIESISASQQLLKTKQNQLIQLKKDVKELTHKNKGLQYKLAQFSRKNRAKSFDQQALQLKQLINENKNLKVKLEDLQKMQEKRQVWLKNNLENVKTLEQKVQTQEQRLPKIQSRKSERSDNSLPKLQSQKKIYTKWLESSREKGNSKLQKQLTDLEKINKMVQEKLTNTQNQITEIEQQISKVKQKVEHIQAQVLIEPSEEKVIKKKDVGSQVSKRVRKSRRDWVGKFESLRFSDSRIVREQARIFKILFNSAGFFQFSYYASKDPKRKYTGKLPFEPSSLQTNGKQSTFTVESPDFIKNIRLKINLKTQKIIQMHVVSNLGIQGQFAVDSPIVATSNVKGKQDNKPVTTAKEEQLQVFYEMDVKPNEAITTVFGSYGFKTDDKKIVTAVWLQGLGVELIEDFIQELI